MLKLGVKDNDLAKILAGELSVWENNYLTEISSILLFYGNTSLEEVHLNKLETIGNYVFCENEKLKKVFLPKIKTIGSNSFGIISTLQEVHIGSDIISIAGNAFSSSNNPNLKIYIDKPQGSVSGAPWGSSTAQVIWRG